MRNRRIKAFIATLAAAAIISGCGKEAPSAAGAQSGNKVSRFFNPLYFNGYLLDPSGRSNGPADWSKAGGESAAAGAGKNEESGTAGTAAEEVDEADYEKGYEKGLADALNVVNKNSASYLKGLEAGKQEVSSTVDINSASYKSGYDAGMKYVHDTKTLDPDDPNYKAGYDDGYKDGTKDGNTTVRPGSDEYNVIYEKGVKDGIKQGETKKNTTTVTNGDSYKKGYEDGLKAAAGKSDSSSQSYKDGYKKGQEDADNRTNPGSENYKSGQESVTLSIKANGDTVTATASNGKALSAKVDATSILKTDLTGTSGIQNDDFSLNAGEYATILPGWVSGKRMISAATLSSQTQGTALARDVLDGKTVWVGGIRLTGSMPDRGAPSTILTSSNKSVTFPSGYYEEFKVSTDVKDAAIPNASIEYIHHQDSLTSTSETYTDTVADASNAKALSLVKVNGVTCSTTGGGCYTTPYYRYEWDTTEQETREDCRTDPGCWTGDGHGNEWWGACDNPGKHCETVVVRTYTAHHTGYGYSTGGHGVTGTWYVKSCGKSNGQLVQANIIYH